MSSAEITETMERWVSSFSEATTKNICNLYDEQASLWGTLSPIKRDSAALIRDYFEQIFNYQDRCVQLNDVNIRIFNNMAISNGLYCFRWRKAGSKVTKVARFSFVYIKKADGWFIIEHHSSAIPELT